MASRESFAAPGSTASMESMQVMLRHIAGTVASQQTEMAALRKEIIRLNTVVASSHSECVNVVAAAAERSNAELASLRSELEKSNNEIRGLQLAIYESEQMAAAKMRHLEEQTMLQGGLATRTVAESASCHERLNAFEHTLAHSATKSVAAPVVVSASTGELGLRVSRLQRQVDDLLAVFEIPNVVTASEGRAVTSHSLAHIVASSSRAQRVKFLHSLPCFHVLWTELFRLSQQQQRHTTAGQLSARRDALEVSGAMQASPVRAAVDGSAMRKSGYNVQPNIVAISGLGIDVVNVDGQRGVTIQRTTKGAAMERAGCMEGDTIISVDDVLILGCFHLLDIVSEAERNQANRMQVAILPCGRSTSIPIIVRVAFQQVG